MGVDIWTWISLGYADITEEVAQKASCLAPKTFASTLRTVKSAMLASNTPNASPSKSDNEIDPTAYMTLINDHKIGQRLRVESWMKDAQAALTALPRYRQDFASRLSESGPEVRIAVFFWVCRTIKVRDAEKKIKPRFSLCTHDTSSRSCSTSRRPISTASRSKSSLAS